MILQLCATLDLETSRKARCKNHSFVDTIRKLIIKVSCMQNLSEVAVNNDRQNAIILTDSLFTAKAEDVQDIT